jgi:hypothetical protein
MGLKDTYSPAELASLAPEELAALETAAGDETGLIAELAAGADTAEGAGADTVAGAAGADTAAGAAGADTTKGAEGADTAAGAATETPAEPGPNPVVYRANVGDVAKEVGSQKEAIKAARGEKRAALMKLNDGEIDADEYARIEDTADAKIDAANDKLLELSRAQTRAETATELTQQQQNRAWTGMLNGYIAKAKGDGIDFAGDAGKRGEFNSLLKAFATEAQDKGMTDDDGMAASKWALDQAASIMGMRYPKAAPAAAAAPAAGAAATQQPAAAAARAGIPPSLGAMPSAAAAPVGDDLMAKVNTLEGDELEAYIASLPKDVANRLFASAQ